MHVGRKYTFISYIRWTQHELLILFIISMLPNIFYLIFGWNCTFIPGYITGVVGTSLAFVISFKNHAAFHRFNIAMDIFTQIQFNSGILAQWIAQLKETDEMRLKILNQHFAWLTCLRYYLRCPMPWGNLMDKGNIEWQKKTYLIPEREISLADALKHYASQQEIKMLSENPMFGLNYYINLQYKTISHLSDCFLKTEINSTISKLYENQLKAIEIKDVPYPRNFYSITEYLKIIFAVILPFSLFSQVSNQMNSHFMASILMVGLVSVLISWIFLCLDKVGQNIIFPFEGNSNDVPITAISQKIIIHMLNINQFEHHKEECKPVNNILM